MELHEENKLMREALTQIKDGKGTTVYAIRQHAEAALQRATAIGPAATANAGPTQRIKDIDLLAHIKASSEAVKDWPSWKKDMWPESSAAQPEGEAAPDVAAAADAIFRYERWIEGCGPLGPGRDAKRPFCVGYNAGRHWAEQRMHDVQQAVADAQARLIDTWKKRAEKAEADLASVRAALAYTERQNGELETALAELHAKPAPQAGDALGSIDTPELSKLIYHFANGTLKARYAAIIEHIDASRREAYYKGRAEGFERGMKQRLMARVEAALAAPPASAAQQD